MLGGKLVASASPFSDVDAIQKNGNAMSRPATSMTAYSSSRERLSRIDDPPREEAAVPRTHGEDEGAEHDRVEAEVIPDGDQHDRRESEAGGRVRREDPSGVEQPALRRKTHGRQQTVCSPVARIEDPTPDHGDRDLRRDVGQEIQETKETAEAKALMQEDRERETRGHLERHGAGDVHGGEQ